MGYGLAATMIRFTVRGIAQSAGSKSAYTPTDKAGNPYRTGGRIVTNVVDANPKAKDWKRLVAMAAQQAYSGEPLRGPVEVRLIFFRQRPKGHYRTGKNAAELRPAAPAYPTSKPDVLKLARGVEDAMTGIVYADDAQIVNELIYKRWGAPRVEIEVKPVGD